MATAESVQTRTRSRGTPWKRTRRSMAKTRWPERIALAGLVVITLVAVIAPLLAPYDAQKPVAAPFRPPSWSHLFGTDDIGRDVFSRVLFGIRLTWFPAIVVVVIGVLIG